MNSVHLIGRLTKNVELKYTPSSLAVANFTIAINDNYMKDKEKVERTYFFDVVAFGKTAEIINQYFTKAVRIGITGKLVQERWSDKDGKNKSKITIQLEEFFFIDPKNENSNKLSDSNYQPEPF